MRSLATSPFVTCFTLSAALLCALCAAPPVAADCTVAGIVCDPLTSWTLYARIDVAEPGIGPIWTDPVTGAYSVELPQDTQTTFTVSAWVAGYTTRTLSTGIVSTTRTLDLALQPTNSAPGYENVQSQIPLEEGFEGAFPPTGWAVHDTDGDANQWKRHSNRSHSGTYACLHDYAYTIAQDGWLVTPAIAISPNAKEASLSFWEFSNYYDDYYRHSLHVSLAPAATPPTGWTEVIEFGSPVASWRMQTVDLTSYASQTVQLAFRYEGTNADAWYIDDVRVDVRETPPGGLLTGRVTDTSGTALVGAIVENNSGDSATAEATPDDPNVGDGLYVLYCPTGTSKAKAEMPGYLGQTHTVTMTTHSVLAQDFQLAHGAPVTISGTVTDALTGWPLYAAVDVDAAGTATQTVWTDPATGAYSVPLAAGSDYALTVQTWVNGYSQRLLDTGVLTLDATFDIAMPPSSDAPGYGSGNTSVLLSGFEESSFPPPGWRSLNIDGEGTAWARSTSLASSGTASAVHQYAGTGDQDGWLITPEIVVPSDATSLTFREYTNLPEWYEEHSLWVRVGDYTSPPNGWAPLAEFGSPEATWRTQSVDISTCTGKSVFLAFRYRGDDADDWYIDEVRLQCNLAVPSGGLVVGTVSDSEGTPLVDASIWDGTNLAATTDATPNDPDENDGFYVLYAPAGDRSLTAWKLGYGGQTDSIAVPAGWAIRRDWQLPTSTSYTLSGVVSDAQAGWPLYARIECAAPGMTTVNTWTDPFTGQYQADLPEAPWTCTATAWVSGYVPTAASAGFLGSNRTLDLPIPPTCNAPGYSTLSIFMEDAESTNTLPTGWATWEAVGGNGEWEWSDYRSYSGSASFRFSPSGQSEDDWLITPPIDLPASSATLTFWEYVSYPEYYGKHSLWVTSDLVTTPSTGWTELAEFDAPEAAWRARAVDLSAWRGQSVRLAFRYEGTAAAYWYVDSISVMSDAVSPPGGLLGGFVVDARTSVPLVAASVRTRDGAHDTTQATPDDPDVGDGLYFVYAPPGTGVTTATNALYAPSTSEIDIAAGQTTHHDYALVKNGLEATPDSIMVAVSPGQSTTRTLTLANIGAETIAFTITSIGEGFTSLTEATSLRKPKPSRDVDIGSAWETRSPLPEKRKYAAVVADNNGYVYVMGGQDDQNVSMDTNYRYNVWGDTWTEMAPMPTALKSIDGVHIDNCIYLPGDQYTSTTYVYHIATDTWSSIPANNGYSARSNYAAFASGTDLWVVAGYLGSVTEHTNEVWKLDTPSGIWSPGLPLLRPRMNCAAGIIDGNVYVLGGVKSYSFTPDMTCEKCDGTTWTFVANVPDGGGAYTRWSYAADGVGAGGRLWVVAGRRDTGWNVLNHAGYYDPQTDSWTVPPAVPLLSQGRTYLEGDVAADGYFYAIGGRDSGGDAYDNNERLYVGHPDFSPDVPWLSVDITSGVLAPAQSVSITVTMDSGVPEAAACGTYAATLAIASPDVSDVADVPVTMVVAPLAQLRVDIEPTSATAAGAMWRLAGGSDLDWNPGGTTRDDVPIGDRMIEFRDVEGFVTPSDQTVTVTTASLATATGVYVTRTCTLQYAAGPNGTIVGNTSQTVAYGASGSAVRAAPAFGYHFIEWSDGRTDNPRTDTNVSADVNVTALFGVNVYTLTYLAGEHGTIDGLTSRTFTVVHGDDGTTVTAIPDTGCQFLKWSDENNANPRIDTAVSSSILITALFSASDTCLCTTQTCAIDSDNQFFLGLYNYTIGGNWAAWLDAQGSETLSYCLPADQWLGFYLYDYASGQWVRALYALKN